MCVCVVRGLTPSLQKVGRKAFNRWKKLQELFALQNNFRNYRVAEAAATPPLLPYIGIVPKDLLAIEETAPNQIDRLINVRKMRLIGRVLRSIYRARQVLVPPPSALASPLPTAARRRSTISLSITSCTRTSWRRRSTTPSRIAILFLCCLTLMTDTLRERAVRPVLEARAS